jgi:hypothetical protein
MSLRSQAGYPTTELLDVDTSKVSLKGRYFQTVEEIQCAVTRELNNTSKTAFLGA